MAEPNKKRTSSFRKLFPNLFFSHKSKDRNNEKETRFKNTADSSSINNHYQNPRSIARAEKINARANQNDSCIYENLAIPQSQYNELAVSEAPSNHSSSSTLVSESVKDKSKYECNSSKKNPGNLSKNFTNHTARPQVPPRPHEVQPQPVKNTDYQISPYPDVYYHSLEKLSENTSSVDEIQTYRSSRSDADPEPVGAEIKKVSTTFLISPKKDAEVRTIQPTRARSLSFNKGMEEPQNFKLHTNTNRIRDDVSLTKPYNYSAPTSPTPVNLKVPNMPKTVSPYQHVRKAMIEAEEKRNSLRSSIRSNITPSPRLQNHSRVASEALSPISTLPRENEKILHEVEKENARQKVEAFYWQKLKELKEKEDEYYMRHPMTKQTKENIFRNSNCSTLNSTIIEPRSYSLPRRQNFNTSNVSQAYANPFFVRGAPERRTDTFISNRSSYGDPAIVYRHPEKLNMNNLSVGKMNTKQTLSQGGLLTRDTQHTNQQLKTGSFGGQTSLHGTIYQSSHNYRNLEIQDQQPINRRLEYINTSSKVCKAPPRPPVRTTSVNKNYNIGYSKTNKNIAGRGPYSESESGSEAGEIQKILQNTIAARETLLMTLNNFLLTDQME